jgi:uncharacterized repeat protein (TIGR01451 family)/fimbrial isopeptide formation D2 family protein
MATPTISNTKSLAGNINYVVTGGSLRTQPNGVDPCAIQSSSSAAISGVPAGATIRAAYLYFVGDGDTADYDITFNGYSLSADSQYNDTLTFLGQDYNYFGGVVDVTAYVGGNGTYTFGGLNAQVTDTPGGAQYCTYQGVIAGWGLVVVYEKSTEPLRVINIFDGLEHVYGSSITKTPGNFKIPASGIDGKYTAITWGGDPDISTALNGYSESTRFNGNALTDAYSPAGNQYNSTINTDGNSSSWGVDIDTYDVSAYLSAGQTTATTFYSTGDDDVYLTAQVISVTNEPVADLAIDSTHSGTWAAGGSGSYTLAVHNNGPQPATGTTTVTDTIPTGLTYASASGTGWSCSYSAPTVTCTTTSSVASGANLPSIIVGVTIDSGAPASVNNVAAVSNGVFDNVAANNSDSDATTILHPDLSGAGTTKTVVDLNGGDADPGDTLRYTITLAESGGAAASNASVTDDIPANVTGFTVVSKPAGSTDSSTGGGGANSTGYLDITGIAIPASGTVTIVLDVTVAAGATPGTAIDNTATIVVPGGTGGSVAAPTVVVSQSQVAASGNKVLYAYDNGTSSRTPQGADTVTPVTINGGANSTWTMTPGVATGKTLQLPAQAVTVQLVVAPSGNGLSGTAGNIRSTTVTLLNGGTPIATSAAVNIVGNSGTQLRTYTINIPATTINPANGLNFRVANGNGTANRRIAVSQRVAGPGSSTMTFTASTVISVDSAGLYSAAYPSNATLSSFTQGATAYVRAVISDPFGSYDVNAASLKLTDANGVVQANNLVMTQVADSGVASRTFEYAYALPGNAAVGNWTATVTGKEGTEGQVTHVANTAFLVGLPVLSIAKSHSGNFTAGTNGSYTLVVTNNSLSAVAGTTTVTDTLPAGLTYAGATGTGWSCGAAGQVVTCTNGAGVPASSSLPAITLTVAVGGSLGTSVANQAQVANPNVNGGAAQVGNIDTATVLHADLSGAGTTKDVVDLNGGDAAPGDTLRYTVTLAESAGAAAYGVSVTDDIPANVTGFNVVSVPAGSTNASTGGGGANGTGYLNVTGIAIPANGTATIVFDVTVAAGATAGMTINNTATINNPNGPGAAPVAPLVTVLQSQVAASGNKVLYVYANQTMSRTRQAGNASMTVNEASTADFTLGAVKKPLVLTPGSTVTVSLITYANGSIGNARTVSVQLYKNGTTQVGTAAGTTPNFTSATPTLRNFTFTVAAGAAGALAAGDTLVLRVTNSSAGSGTRSLGIDQFDGTNRSTVSFATATVINVDSVNAYNTAYSGTGTSVRYLPGGTVYVRAVISDPFGSDDVNHATVTITNPAGTVKVNAGAMGQVAEDTVNATRTFEYTYVLPSNARLGSWTASVKGYEGVENTITHTGNASFNVEGAITLGGTWGGTATAGDTVSLSISGGTTATAGSSTAPSTVSPASATSAAGTTITLGEAFTVGLSGTYTVELACSKASDSSIVVVSGSGLSRTITMPDDSSVNCVWDNSKTVPLTVVKLTTVVSDPVNLTVNPKRIPGAVVEYQVIVTNPAAKPIDPNSVFVRDPMPPQVVLRVADLGGAGSGPVSFSNGSPPSGMTYTFVDLANLTDDLQFSNDSGVTWNYVPSPDADGYDAAVTGLRVNPKGTFGANNAQFTVKFRVRIR